ncbi:MAG: hypothetical protein DMG58_32405 [Acidobacteria bacterium]|nr:MAG: hypothetical protein DMG58_32405 [Acidobacteriota bacterium]
MQESPRDRGKFAILFAATILAAWKLIDLDPDKPNMAKGYFVGDSFWVRATPRFSRRDDPEFPAMPSL